VLKPLVSKCWIDEVTPKERVNRCIILSVGEDRVSFASGDNCAGSSFNKVLDFHRNLLTNNDANG
jgi:hypothetical protein